MLMSFLSGKSVQIVSELNGQIFFMCLAVLDGIFNCSIYFISITWLVQPFVLSHFKKKKKLIIVPVWFWFPTFTCAFSYLYPKETQEFLDSEQKYG